MTQLRKIRSFVLLLVMALLMLWVIAASWPRGDVVWSMLPNISQGILTGVSFLLLVGAALFIPGLAATTVVVEKDRRSWDLLALTLLRPPGIVVGKLFSAIGLYLLYVVALFPMLAVVFFLVGIDWLQLTLSLSLVLITCVTCGAVGMACSAMSRKTVTAMAGSYFGMSLVMGLPSFVLMVLLSFWVGYLDGFWFPNVEDIIVAMSPFAVLMETTLGLGMFATPISTVFFYHVAYQAAITVVALLVTMWALRRPAKVSVLPMNEGTSRMPVKRPSMRERLHRRGRRFRKPQPPIRDRQNPMYARELRWGPAGSRRAYTWALLLMFGISLSLYSSSTDGAIAALVLHGIIVSCLVPTLLAGSFTREYELRSLDMLRMTLVTPRELVRGKFIAAFRLAFLLSLFSLMANMVFLVDAWLQDEFLPTLAAGQVSLFICALLAAFLALFASVITKRTGTAVVTSFCFVLSAYFGLFFLLFLLFNSVRGAMTTDVFSFLVNFTSPVIGYYVSLQDWPRPREMGYAWIVNVVEFALVTLLVYYATQTFYRRYRVRER